MGSEDKMGTGGKKKSNKLHPFTEGRKKVKLVADEVPHAMRMVLVDRVLRRRLSLRTRQNRGDGGLASRNRKRCGDDRLADRHEIVVLRRQRHLDDLRRRALHRSLDD